MLTRGGKKVILHIGLHKTGTTAIQKFMASHGPALAAAGLSYPLDLPEGAINPHAQHYIANYAQDDHPLNEAWGYSREFAAAFRERIEEAPGSCAFISSEGFDALSEEKVARFAGMLEGLDVTVLVYLRRQDNYLQSLYQTRVVLAPLQDFPDISNFTPRAGLNYAGLLERWAAAFGRDKLIVRVYERGSLEGGDIIADLLAVLAGIGYPIDRPPDERLRENLSLPTHYIEAARLAARDCAKDKDYWNRIRRAGFTLYPDYSGDQRFLRPSDRRGLLDRYADSNRKVAEMYLGRTDGVLFRDTAVPGDDAEWEVACGNSLACFTLVAEDAAARVAKLEAEVRALRKSAERGAIPPASPRFRSLRSFVRARPGLYRFLSTLRGLVRHRA